VATKAARGHQLSMSSGSDQRPTLLSRPQQRSDWCRCGGGWERGRRLGNTCARLATNWHTDASASSGGSSD